MQQKEIYFAAGCFWGTERLYQSIRGVTATQCGFANGKQEVNAPSYQQVCTGTTDCREAVHVTYDPEEVTLPQLLKAYFTVVDPTVYDRQGNDVGSQYQTGIYCTEEESLEIVRDYCSREAEKYPVFAVEVGLLQKFYPAEEYHQSYLLKNPTGYCHIPRVAFETIDAYIRKDGL